MWAKIGEKISIFLLILYGEPFSSFVLWTMSLIQSAYQSANTIDFNDNGNSYINCTYWLSSYYLVIDIWHFVVIIVATVIFWTF